MVEPGKGVGRVKLGQTLAQVEQILGKPDKVEANPNDPDAKLYVYRKWSMIVFVGSNGKVIGVGVNSADYKTGEGVGVGSPRSAVEKAYGRGLNRGEGRVTYAERGLGLTYEKEKVSYVFVVGVEQARPLLGDRLIVPGRRVGDIRLGTPGQDVLKAWGQPSSAQPLSGLEGEMWVYKEQGIGLAVVKGKVQAILVSTGDFITAEGIKPGSSADEVVKAYGKGYEQSGDHRWYAAKGIGFQLVAGRVSEVRIVAPSKE